jgi:hypothetical protein
LAINLTSENNGLWFNGRRKEARPITVASADNHKRHSGHCIRLLL